MCQAAEGGGVPGPRLHGGSPGLASAHSAPYGSTIVSLEEYQCRFTEEGQSTARAGGPYKGLEGGKCWAHGCSPRFLLLELPGRPLRHGLPPCLVTTQPASHLRDSLVGSCPAIRAAWMVSDPASMIARAVPCTPHVLLPTSLGGEDFRDHVFQMRTLKLSVLPSRIQGQTVAGLGLKTKSETSEDACFGCTSARVRPAAG